MQRVEVLFAHWSGLFDAQHHSKLARSTYYSRSAGFSFLLNSVCCLLLSISQFKPHGRRECLAVRRWWQFRNLLASFPHRIIHHRVPGTFNDFEFGDGSIRFDF